MATQDTARMSREDRAAAHVLPRWIQFVQSHILLSALLLAEGYLLGDLMQRGWVANIESPGAWFSHWGVYHGVGVVLFFIAGAASAGVALACSVKAAACFADRRIGTALFNMLGLLAIMVMEVWASLSERSANLAPTPADQAVLDILNIHGLPLSPTVVVVALLLPLTTIYYGFSQHKPESETPEEQQARQTRELAEARYKAQLRQVQAANLAGIGRAFVTSAIGAKDATLSMEDDQPSPDNQPPDDGGNVSPFRGKDGRVSTGKDGARGKAGSGRGQVGALPKNMLTADDLRQYLAREAGTIISETDALAFIKAQSSAERVIGVQGQPWAALKAPTLQSARRKFASGNTAHDEAL